MEITINQDSYTAPQSWNELSLRDLLSSYHIIMQETGSLFSATELIPAKRISLLQRLVGIDDEVFTQWRQDCIEEHGEQDGHFVFLDEVSQCLAVADALFDEEDGAYQIRLGLTRCPWPRLRLGKQTLYAPADGLANITIYEMSMIFSVFERYLESRADDDLHELLAIIYRPGKPKTKKNKLSNYQGDRRLPLLHFEATIPDRAEHMARLDSLVKQVMLFWVASCRQAIIEQFPVLFSSPTAERPDPFGWGGVLMVLAGGLENLDSVSQQSYSNALVYLSYLEDQRRRQEQSLARNTV